jgi:deazaflavin-dependent oxidoreductase (nitroreductase family)
MSESLGNKFMKFMINLPLGGLMGESLAVITVTGRKSGKLISTPINVVKVGNSYTVISSRDRTWWRNLRGGASATLRVAGKTHKVIGQVLESNIEVKTGLTLFYTQMPMMAKYLKIHINKEGSLNEDDLERVVSERIIVHLEIQK